MFLSVRYSNAADENAQFALVFLYLGLVRLAHRIRVTSWQKYKRILLEHIVATSLLR